MSEENLFVVTEAPIFKPTNEEFQDPLGFINKIRPIAEKFGLCKIIPPKEWCPPFATDVDKFKFVPKSQKVTSIKGCICTQCFRCDAFEKILFCSVCHDGFHSFCLEQPNVSNCSDEPWQCTECSKEVKISLNSKKRYSLRTFGDIADEFKAEYFNMPPTLVSPARVEEEFWKLHSSPEEDVSVECGENLSSRAHGSGFFKSLHSLHPPVIHGTAAVVSSPWNLHNLAVMESSVLHHLKDTNLHVPRIDVGMCFSMRCWRQEEHWLYGCSYLHWGDSKTWYSIPGQSAEQFEELVQSASNVLEFPLHPDELANKGLPVYRIDQNACEFIIVFPQTYHLSFSHGYNFSESINFAPSHWISYGRICEQWYAEHNRPNTFSFQEALCRMVCSWPRLNSALASSVYQNIQQVFEDDTCSVKAAREKGIKNVSKQVMELIPSDDRRCVMCHTICFLSAVICSCQPKRMACLDHYDFLCECDPEKYTIRFRYSEDEIPQMVKNLKSWVENFDDWNERARSAIQGTSPKEDLGTLKSLLSEVDNNGFPETSLVRQMRSIIAKATHLGELCGQLNSKKVRTRTWASSEAKVKLSLDELASLCEEVDKLVCRIPEANGVNSLFKRARDCRARALDLLSQDLPDCADLEECIEHTISLDIYFPEITLLKQRIVQVEWLDEVSNLQEAPDQVTMYALRRLISIGIALPPHSRVEQALTELQVLLRSVEDWQERAKQCLDVKCRQHISTLELLLEEAVNIPAYLPNIGALHNVLKKGKEWIVKVETIKASEDYPYLETVEKLVAIGRSIPLDLEQLPELEAQVVGAKAWRDRTSRTFLRKNSLYSLIQALAPRTVVGVDSLLMSKKQHHFPYQHLYDLDDVSSVDPATVVSAFKNAEQLEMTAMRELRMINQQKRARDTGNSSYCICRRGISGFMLQCELCKDWFHATCVPLPKSPGSKSRMQTPAQQLAAAASREVKFLCPCCLRSRRPRLETILSLLVTMHKVLVRLPEGDALKCLTERAMNWQDRARQTLATQELASALAKLSVLSQKLVEAAAREKTEKIISSELKKAASKPELGIHMMTIRTSQTSGADRYSECEEPGMSYSNSEHAYSSASKPVQGVSNNPCNMGGGKYNKGRSGTYGSIDNQMQAPLLSLSEGVQAELEELMMEGDLLEVSLDETQHIWRILQATKVRHHDKYPDVQDFENELLACKMENDRLREEQESRKRRRDFDSAMYMPKKMRVKYPKEFDKFNRSRIKEKRRIIKKEVRNPRGPRKAYQLKRAKRNFSDEEGDECSARPCLHPKEQEVDWVQCDGGCELWFHLFCLGLDKKDVKKDEDFICKCCQTRGQL